MNVGIYRIRNLKNGKCYYGSSGNLKKRRGMHFRAFHRGDHINPLLQGAWNKYGESAFTFEILAILEISELLFTEQKLLHRGQYNIAKDAEAPTRGLKYSEESKQKISRALSGKNNPLWGKKRSFKTRQKISESLKGRKHSPESLKKMSEIKKGKRHSLKTRRKISEAAKKRWDKIKAEK